LREFGHHAVSFGRVLLATERERRVIEWVEGGFDKTLRLDYDLTADALVFDVGGYEGQWTSDIFSRYCCSVHVFEPNKEFAAAIRDRFVRNPKIVVYDFGLGRTSTNQARLYLRGQGSSLFREAGSAPNNTARTQTVRLVCAADFFADHRIDKVDLMKINIEGGEYDLLEHLIEVGIIDRITNIQVQFHDFVPDAQTRMSTIHQQLRKTHDITFQSKFVWENWAKKRADCRN
jgi:FkbM family methyltransferase